MAAVFVRLSLESQLQVVWRRYVVRGDFSALATLNNLTVAPGLGTRERCRLPPESGPLPGGQPDARPEEPPGGWTGEEALDARGQWVNVVGAVGSSACPGPGCPCGSLATSPSIKVSTPRSPSIPSSRGEPSNPAASRCRRYSCTASAHLCPSYRARNGTQAQVSALLVEAIMGSGSCCPPRVGERSTASKDKCREPGHTKETVAISSDRVQCATGGGLTLKELALEQNLLPIW